MILILTNKGDIHVDAVTEFIPSDIPWVRINIEDFAVNVELDVCPASGTGRLAVKDSGKIIELGNIGAVWYRKPEPVSLEHFEIGEPAALDYVEAEFTEIVHGIYGLLGDAYWINNPFVSRAAHRKLLQLKTAARLGFTVPKTLLTNRPASARHFADGLDKDLAIKSLGAISVMREDAGQTYQYGIFTRRITGAELEDHSDKVPHMPTLFQAFIEKESELRITCAGTSVFACEIRPRPGDVTADDYRFDTAGLPHYAVERPDLVDRMHAYMRAFRLEFGCFDFIIPKGGGEPIFLEMNPNGQWLWVQRMTGQNIGKAIADELVRAALGHVHRAVALSSAA